jgi:hypothetical protein
VAALLTNDLVSEVFKCADNTISGHAARQFHAASTWINSSFT